MKPLYTLAAWILAALFTAMPLAAAGSRDKPAAQSPVRIAALNGPSAIPMAYLFENAPDLGGRSSSFEVMASPDVLIPRLLKGEIDVSVLPPNAAAKIYNTQGAIVMGAVVGNGMLSVLTTDPTASTPADFAGKKITVAGQGSTPDYIARYVFGGNGLTISDTEDGTSVVFDYSLPTAEIAAALASDRIESAIVPEPFATVALSASDKVCRAFDIQAAYADLSGMESFPMTVLVARADFAAKSPDTFRALLAAYKEAVAWTIANPSDSGALVEKHTLGLAATLAARAIPNAAFVFEEGSQAKSSVESLLSVFLALDPDSVGGKLPDSGFYFAASDNE